MRSPASACPWASRISLTFATAVSVSVTVVFSITLNIQVVLHRPARRSRVPFPDRQPEPSGSSYPELSPEPMPRRVPVPLDYTIGRVGGKGGRITYCVARWVRGRLLLQRATARPR